jgi:hypothetical protein
MRCKSFGQQPNARKRASRSRKPRQAEKATYGRRRTASATEPTSSCRHLHRTLREARPAGRWNASGRDGASQPRATRAHQPLLGSSYFACPRKCPAAPVGSAPSARHGCTASASLAITTQSVSELRQLVRRKRRSFSGYVA